MRLLARLVAVAGLVVAGGLTLPGGAAQAAACSGSSGVTVVIDYGSRSSTLCAADHSSAGAVLATVASVTYVAMYGHGVVCKINDVPSGQTCQRMPPANAYWAFFHAPRGGSWAYSSSGVADYDPAPGSVIGFAFGSGAAPSSAPPAATASTPKPSPKPSPSSASSRPSSKPQPAKPKPAGSTAAKPESYGTSPSKPTAGTSTVPGSSGSATLGAKPSTTTGPGSTPSTTSPGTTPAADATSRGESTSAASTTPGSGTPVTLLAGLGLVGLVGAGAAYLTVRRRAIT